MKIHLTAAAGLLLCGGAAAASTFEEAREAYSGNRVAEAEQALKQIAEQPQTGAAERAQALRELARISWHVDADAAAALAYLGRAEATGEGRCDNATLTARVLQESDGDGRLVERLDALTSSCSEANRAALIRLRGLTALLDQAMAVGKPSKEALDAGEKLASGLTPDVAGSLFGAAVRLELGLLRNDAAAALSAWKDYFWLSDGDLPQAMKSAYPAARPVFERGLAPAASVEARVALAQMLVRAGFAQPAERFARANDLEKAAADRPAWKKVAAYLAARRSLVETVLASNRVVARGGKPADLKAAADRMVRELAAAAGRGGGEASRVLEEAYGLHGQVGDTDGHASIHYGHIVQSERHAIEQYGHRADVAFLALDNMLSNGFNSWLWDGQAAAGGWAEADRTIVQVRPAYTSGPLNAWGLFSGEGRQKLLERQAERAAADVAALARQPIAYMPGLADRLRIQVVDQIGAAARAQAADGDLRRAFLQEYRRATFQQSILTHEGRHALDKSVVTGAAQLTDTDLEYRAKLSELALADYPRLALVNINDSTVGSSSGHGLANARLLTELAQWADGHRAEVEGFDPAIPAAAQLDKLSDAQLRAIARSLDPLASGAVGPPPPRGGKSSEACPSRRWRRSIHCRG